jgi:hypothetical protein
MRPANEGGARRTADHAETRHDDRRTRSLAALAVILFLAVIAIYLVQRLRTAAELQDCLMSGRTNCAPIEAR